MKEIPMPNKQDAVKLLPPIEHAEDDSTRAYIPLAGGYEFQTKGNGSTVRLLCPDGQQQPLSWNPPWNEQALDVCMRAHHAALAARAPTPREQELEAQNKALWELVNGCEIVLKNTEGRMRGHIMWENEAGVSMTLQNMRDLIAAIQKVKEVKV